MKMVKHICSEELVLDNEVINDMQKPNIIRILLFSSFNLGLYVLLCWIGAFLQNGLAWFIVWSFQGFILSGFIAPVHECVHNNLTGSIKFNRLMGVLWSLPITVNFSSYKYWHFEHHKHTGLAGDTADFDDYLSLRDYVLDLLILNIFDHILESIDIIRGKLPDYINSEKARREIKIDSFALLGWIVLVITFTIIWTKFTVMFYWCPLVLSFPSAFLITIPEHYGCDKTCNSFNNTRTTRSNLFVRCVMWNANYHAEHHTYPSVPFCNLPTLHALIGNHYQYQEQSYFLFHFKLIQSLQNKDGTIKEK
jgi:fatty acid desaturase